jgi:murein DD-endopeptidase MepM/ murein hydrolase activator NlpD
MAKVAVRVRLRRKSTRRFTPAATAVWLTAGALAAASVSADTSTGGTGFLGHVFPVAGPHWTRGAIGEFGAPRSGGRVHEGFDVVAGCGTPLVSVRGGRVRRAGYDPVLYGNYLLVHGEGERRSYFYAHLRRPAIVDRGDRVFPGRRLGAVGVSGHARPVGCRRPFEIHVDGEPIDPEAALRRWDRYS